jgi:parallel beta-helix repeat protein
MSTDRAKHFGRVAVVSALVCGVVVLNPTSAHAAHQTWIVDDDGAQCPGPDSSTVQGAIDNLAFHAGDTIIVCEGTYEEDLSIIDDDIELRALGAQAATVLKGVGAQAEGSFPDATASTNIDIRADGVSIHGFTIQSPDLTEAQYSSGIVLVGTNIEIFNNAFEVVTTDPAGAPDANGNAPVAIQTYAVGIATDNDAQNDVDGLWVHDNTFTGEHVDGYYGVYVNDQADTVDAAVTVEDNTMTGTIWRGISTERNSSVIDENSITTDTDPATFTTNSGVMVHNFIGDLTVDGVTISNNTIAGAASGFAEGIRLGFPASPVTLTDITVTNNSISDATVGVKVHDSAGGITVEQNNLAGNTDFGADNDDAGTLDAECNWWGAASGPSGAGAGTGDAVSADVDFTPWLVAAAPAGACTGGAGGGGGGGGGGGAPNEPPVATNDSVFADEDTPAVIDVLANDSDPDDDPLSVSDITVDPANGSVVINANGTVTYMPTDGFTGTDSFEYEVSDGKDGTDTSAVTITVEPLGDLSQACPAGKVPEDGSTDVAEETTHERAIDCVAWWEVVLGFADGTYGPNLVTRRDQMASFTTRLLDAVGFALPANPPDAFDDDEGNIHELSINQLAALGLVNGTGPRTYSPAAGVTRAHMATFLVGVYELVTGTDVPVSADYFTDDEGNIHEPNINALRQLGITTGVTETLYDPSAFVERDQMASFLARLLDRLVEEGFASPPG